MTKLELLKKPKKYPDSIEILVSKDAEGNGFSKLHDVSEYTFTEDDYEIELHDKNVVLDEPDLEVKQCLVLWP